MIRVSVVATGIDQAMIITRPWRSTARPRRIRPHARTCAGGRTAIVLFGIRGSPIWRSASAPTTSASPNASSAAKRCAPRRPRALRLRPRRRSAQMAPAAGPRLAPAAAPAMGPIATTADDAARSGEPQRLDRIGGQGGDRRRRRGHHHPSDRAEAVAVHRSGSARAGAPVQAEEPRTFIPPQAERVPMRAPRMPRIDELPVPAQNEIRARRGEMPEEHHPEKQRMSLLQRLASVGLGRREHDEPAASACAARTGADADGASGGPSADAAPGGAASRTRAAAS